ncbi:oxidoreductase [Mycobacterium sp. djl-10]|nr:oxidoreductase [Mycobacterium sp. djl-10]
MSARVLVTGVDTELGAAVRRQLAADGAATVGVQAVAGQSAEHTLSAHPGDRGAIRAAVGEATALMGGLDTLVVAHALPMVAGFEEQTMGDFWEHVDTALSGSFFYAQAAGEVMRTAGTGGRIVLTTSTWHIGAPKLSAVATAAGGIVALTKTLARDLGRFGVGVNAVAVGSVDSEWSVCDAGAPLPPAGATGTVTQVARVIALLSKHCLGAAVGQIVNVDGGLSRNRV